MSIIDEELQNQIENSGKGDGIDAHAYKKVFSTLSKPPEFHLSADFADKVVARIEAQKETSKDMIWIAAGIIGFLVAAVIAIVLTNYSFNFGAFKFIAGYPWLVIFGIALILGLQWLDKKVVRPSVPL